MIEFLQRVFAFNKLLIPMCIFLWFFFLNDTVLPFYFLELNLKIRIEGCIYVQDFIFIKFNLNVCFYYMNIVKKEKIDKQKQ